MIAESAGSDPGRQGTDCRRINAGDKEGRGSRLVSPCPPTHPLPRQRLTTPQRRLSTQTAVAYENLANAIVQLPKREPDAIKLYQKSVAIKEALVQARALPHEQLAEALSLLGILLKQCDRWDLAPPSPLPPLS